MKNLYYLNKFVLITTLVFYLTIFLGLYAQIALGAVQLLSALILFLYWKVFSKKTKKQLYIYWLIVALYGVLCLFDWKNINNGFIIILGFIVIPMLIAGYFFYIINSVKNIKK